MVEPKTESVGVATVDDGASESQLALFLSCPAGVHGCGDLGFPFEALRREELLGGSKEFCLARVSVSVRMTSGGRFGLTGLAVALLGTSLGFLGRRTEGADRNEPTAGDRPPKSFGVRGVDGGMFGL
jgi:hypothetical protein